MADNRSTKEKYTDLSSEFAPTIRDPGDRFAGVFDTLTNEANRNAEMVGEYAGQSNIDPEAFVNQFLNNSGSLSNAVTGVGSQLQQTLNSMAEKSSKDALQAQGSQFGNKGALNSSAAAAAMGRAAAEPFAQTLAQTQQNQLGLTGNLWNQAMGGLQQGNIAAGQQAGNMAGLFANQAANAQNNLARLAPMQMTISQPQLEYQQTPWESFWGNANTAIQPVAGAVGTGVGAATGLSSAGSGK